MRAYGIVSGMALLVLAGAVQGQTPGYPADNLTPNYKAPVVERDFDKRVVMIPMRDGVKLYTVIVVAKTATAKSAPIALTRTCYNAAGRAARSDSPRMIEALPYRMSRLWRRATSASTRMCAASMGRRERT